MWVVRPFAILVLAGAGTCVPAPPSRSQIPTIHATVASAPSSRLAGRIGINLGSWTAWGAEQLMANVIKNPGFEGLIDRSLVVVKDPAVGRFSDDTTWLARPDGFWTGADWNARTGSSAGKTGKILGSHSAAGSFPSFEVDPAGADGRRTGDVVSLTRVSDEGLPTQWWVPDDRRDLVGIAPGDPAHSGGKRSLALAPLDGRKAAVASYLDGIARRSGPLLPVEGRWRLTFWARRVEGTPTLRVTFGRVGATPLAEQSAVPSLAWHRESIEFGGEDTKSVAPLALQFEASGSGRVLLDDVDLRRLADAGRAFRLEVEEALRDLHPGYLRDWEGQLGDTLENRLASEGARRASRYRPESEAQAQFGYSLSDFLTLTERLGARPWIVLPTTFSDDECRALGRYLAGWPGFDEIVVEFGNENWNPLFRPAGIVDAASHAAAADRAFSHVREGAGSSAPLRFALNGQNVNISKLRATAAFTRTATILAVAPYFLPQLTANAGIAELFAADREGVAQAIPPAGREFAVYEVNAHTLGGDAPAAVRDAVTAGRAAGAALARRLVLAAASGVTRQCVYSLAGYDAWLDDRSGFAKLFGVVRDLGPTRRMRPTGLAVAMLNRAISGAVHPVDLRGPLSDQLTAAAFHLGEGRWSAALINGAADDVNVTWTFPEGVRPRHVLTLSGAPGDTNEDGDHVRIVESTLDDENGGTVRVPGYDLVVLLPAED